MTKQDKAHIIIKKGKGNITRGVWFATIIEGTTYTIHNHVGDKWFSVEVKGIERDNVHDLERAMGHVK